MELSFLLSDSKKHHLFDHWMRVFVLDITHHELSNSVKIETPLKEFHFKLRTIHS